MSWLYLPEQVADNSPANCLTGAPSATSKTTLTPSKCSKPASRTDTSTTPRSGTTSVPSTGNLGLDAWILSLPVSPASHSAEREGNSENTTPAISGLIPFALFERSDPHGAYWRMSQGCFPTLMFDEFSETWPRAGTMLNGIAYRRQPLAPITSEIGSGLWPTPRLNTGPSIDQKHLSLDGAVRLWPTPVVSRGKYSYSHGKRVPKLAGAVEMWPTPTVADTKTYWHNRGKEHPSLAGAVRMFPTPTASNTKAVHLRTNGRPPRTYLPTPNTTRFNTTNSTTNPTPTLFGIIGGQLNPNWVEWLMGWPIGWTDLKPLATDKFLQWQNSHGKP